MRLLASLVGLGLSLCLAPDLSSAADGPLRVFIRAGQKTHGPGEHDSPRFLAEWSALLAARGVKTAGAQRFPSEAELAATDVLIVFAPGGGNVAPDERRRLSTFLGRGGGLVVLHDGVVSKDPHWWKTVIGGAWEDGRSKYHHGQVGLHFDRTHAITAGLADHFLDDEIYWDLTFAPGVRVLANGFRTVQEITPQVWTYETKRHRAFVSLQGHKHATFGLPHHRALVLRGIAWAARRPADSLTVADERAALRYPPGGPLPPDRARATLRTRPGFEVSLVGAEPQVVKPVSFDFDARGRLWIVETPQYPERAALTGRPPRDDIAILEDADGDGKWERRTVFCDRLDLPTSLALHRDGVIVTQAPQILFLRDTDGDGTCDRREVLFSGFGTFDTHAVISNVRWGLDGWLYANQGYSGRDSRDIRNAAGKSFGAIGNGVFRFKPDGSAIELVSSLEANNWGLDFDWDGELFFTMANGSHLRHVVLPEAALARAKVGATRSWHQAADHADVKPIVQHTLNPYVQIDHIGGFTAASGGTVYRGGAWPKEYDGTHFVSEPTVNLVHHDRVRAKGATYDATKAADDEFLAGTDLWFRPVATRVGPDGALYVADFYNLAAVHNDTRGPPHDKQNAAVRPDRDHEHGRIWRVQHGSAPRAARPALDRADAATLASALGHASGWHRMTAHRLLVERGERAAVRPALRAQSAPARVLALWTLAQTGGLTAADVTAALGDRDPGVRKNAARIAATMAEPAVLTALRRRVGDGDARVRIAALLALGATTPDAATVSTVVGAFPRLGDDWSRSAAASALAAAPADGVRLALAAGQPDKLRPLVEALTAAAAEKQDPAVADRLVALAAARPRSPLSAVVLARLGAGLRPDVRLGPEGQGAVAKLLLRGDPALIAAVLPLAARAGETEALRAAASRLLTALPTQSDPVPSLRALLAVGHARASAIGAAGKLLADGARGPLHAPIIEALGTAADPAVAPALVDAMPSLAAGARSTAIAQLLRRPEWSLTLVGALEAQRLRPQDLGPATLFRLRNHADRAVAARAGKTLDTLVGAAGKEKDEIVAALLPAVQKPGDPTRGRELTEKNCLVCHTYKGQGRHVAPDLTGMGTRGPAELLVHVVDPNRAVEPNYLAFDVSLKNGSSVNGIVARENASAVVLLNATGEVEVKRADIKTMASSGLSLMPEGFESLGPEALRDMLAYLCEDGGRYRTIDLAAVASATTGRLYGREGLRLQGFGLKTLDGIPFQIADPAASVSGNNALVLAPGAKVDIPVGYALQKLHVLGGIAAQGATEPARGGAPPIAKVTYHYADGKREERVLRDGVEFAAWQTRVDVPGSKYVTGLIPEGVRGQVRRFAIQPARHEAIAKLTVESVGGAKLPAFLALTAEVNAGPRAPAASGRPSVLILGGGSSHDFDRWFRDADVDTLSSVASVQYTADPAQALTALPKADILVVATNQPLPDPALRSAIFQHVAGGKGLLLLHPATWYNWKDWPDYNRALVSGGARGHESYGEFEVTVTGGAHPLLAGVPPRFTLKDELYRVEREPGGPAPQVLAIGRSLTTKKEYPVLWSVTHGKGRVVSLTLGHDGAAHEHPAYQALLRNAIAHLAGKGAAR